MFFYGFDFVFYREDISFDLQEILESLEIYFSFFDEFDYQESRYFFCKYSKYFVKNYLERKCELPIRSIAKIFV